MTQRSSDRITNSIRVLRFQHSEMTQQALADLVGVTRQTIVAIEQGRYSPSLEAAFKTADEMSAKQSTESNFRIEL